MQTERLEHLFTFLHFCWICWQSVDPGNVAEGLGRNLAVSECRLLTLAAELEELLSKVESQLKP